MWRGNNVIFPFGFCVRDIPCGMLSECILSYAIRRNILRSAGTDYFTLTSMLGPLFPDTTVHSFTWTDSTPLCFIGSYRIINLPCIAAAMHVNSPADTAQHQLFAIIFETTWGNIPTGDVTKDVTVQILTPDSITYSIADEDSVTVSRVDTSGIYGTFKDVMFDDLQAVCWSNSSGSFHVPAPK